MARAFFLDRDGTINEDRGYVHAIEQFVFLPGAVEAIKMINRHGFLAVVVTNQSGIGRGYYSVKDMEYLHGHVSRRLACYGARIDAWYWCPHHPADGCPCRKPRPGLLLKAARELGIDLAGSCLAGNGISDVEAALRAGCRAFYTGRENRLLPGEPAVRRFDSLPAAVQSFLRILS